jgi:hypothetical protein
MVKIGDVNGDGRLDIVSANSEGSVSMLHGKGGGTFNAKLDYSAGAGAEYGMGQLSAALGDVDGDGKIDVVVAGVSADAVSVLLNSCR